MTRERASGDGHRHLGALADAAVPVRELRRPAARASPSAAALSSRPGGAGRRSCPRCGSSCPSRPPSCPRSGARRGWRRGSGPPGPSSRCTTPRSSPSPDGRSAIADPLPGSPIGWAILPEWWIQQHVDRFGSATARGSSATGCPPLRELVESGEIDVLTGDWLAELTMLILARQRMKHGAGSGYARTFLTQMEQVLGTCLDRGIRVVSNAGGLDPQGCADALGELATTLGLSPRIGVVTGDNVLPIVGSRPEDFPHLDTGEALGRRAPHHRQRLPRRRAGHRRPGRRRRRRHHRADHRRRAGRSGRPRGGTAGRTPMRRPATRSRWTGWPGPWPPATSSSAGPRPRAATTRSSPRSPPGPPASRSPRSPPTGPASSRSRPGPAGWCPWGRSPPSWSTRSPDREYANPDVTALFDTIALAPAGPDRVTISGVRGAPAPEKLKVAVNLFAGFRNTMSLVLTGRDAACQGRPGAAHGRRRRARRGARRSGRRPPRPEPARPRPSQHPGRQRAARGVRGRGRGGSGHDRRRAGPPADHRQGPRAAQGRQAVHDRRRGVRARRLPGHVPDRAAGGGHARTASTGRR